MPRMQRYEEIADDLRSKIKSKEYPPGSQLPSRTELRQMYDVSDGVVEKAMMLLRLEQLTETLPGVGVYVRKDE
jgi:GntR family transcriptional regulator